MPNDEVIARIIPEYKTQTSVTVNGEVIFPGAYNLLKKNETLANIIQRAGGLTSEAFLEGLTIMREGQVVVTQLDQALKNSSSNYNLGLKDGDIITIPEKEDLVAIVLANTGVADFTQDTNTIRVVYEQGKSAKWYIDEFAAGFGANADRERVFVAYPNGRTKVTKNFLGLKTYPKPKKGATISVGAKLEMTEADKKKMDASAQTYPKLKKGVILTLDPEILKSLKVTNQPANNGKSGGTNQGNKE